MDNAKLGRAVLDEIIPGKNLNMLTWGKGSHEPGQEWACGTTACLAGHAMILAGYSLKHGTFYRPDGAPVLSEGKDAQELLGMCAEERAVFALTNEGSALAWFREMVEAAEKREVGNGTVLG